MSGKKYQILKEAASKSGIQDIHSVEQRIRLAVRRYDSDPEIYNSLLKKFRRLSDLRPTPFTLPPKGKLDGPIQIGTNIRGGSVGITKGETAHSLLIGRTQVGKSTTLGRLGFEVNNTYEDVAMIMVGPKKSLRGIIEHIPNLYPIRLDDLKFNPLSASFENPQEQKRWISSCWEIIARESDLLTGSREFGLKLFKEVLEEHKSKEYPPTMFDLLDKAQEKVVSISPSSPEYNYAERFKSRIEGMLFSLEETFDCRRGFPVEEFLNPEKHILLETDGIPRNHATILTLLLLNSIYHYNLTHGYRDSGIKIMAFIDEAEDFIGYDTKHDKSKKGSSFSNLLLERGRELGLSLIMSCHHTKIASSAFQNLNSRICMDLSSSDDVNKIASDMGLNEDQAESLEELDVGEAVMKVKGKWDEPFLVKVEPVELNNVSDQEVKERSENFLKEMEDYVVPRKKRTSKQKSTGEKSEKSVTKQEHVLMENMAKFPYLSISSRKDRLGWSNSKLSKIRKSLRSQGFIRKKRVNKPEGGRGSSLTLLELTGKALNYLKGEGIETNYLGRGGVAHSYYLNFFLENLKKKSVDVSYETDLGDGVWVDLFIVKGSGETQAIEVEVSNTDQTLEKLRSKKLLDKVDKCLIACDKKVLVDEFKQKIEEMNIDQDRVRVRKIQNIEF